MTTKDSEHWLHEEADKSKLEEGLAWAAQTAAAVTEIEALEAELLSKWEEIRGNR